MKTIIILIVLVSFLIFIVYFIAYKLTKWSNNMLGLRQTLSRLNLFGDKDHFEIDEKMRCIEKKFKEEKISSNDIFDYTLRQENTKMMEIIDKCLKTYR